MTNLLSLMERFPSLSLNQVPSTRLSISLLNGYFLVVVKHYHASHHIAM